MLAQTTLMHPCISELIWVDVLYRSVVGSCMQVELDLTNSITDLGCIFTEQPPLTVASKSVVLGSVHQFANSVDGT